MQQSSCHFQTMIYADIGLICDFPVNGIIVIYHMAANKISDRYNGYLEVMTNCFILKNAYPSRNC